MKLLSSTCCALVLFSISISILARAEPASAAMLAEAEVLHHSAKRAYRDGNLAEAIPLYREALKISGGAGVSQKSEFLGRFAEALAAQGNKQKDVGLLTEAITI